MKARFFRNPLNYDTLRYYTSNYRGILSRYIVIATVELDEFKFKEFCCNFQCSYNFLDPYIDEAVVKNDIWKSILIKRGKDHFLVVMNHYQYPRYMALLSE